MAFGNETLRRGRRKQHARRVRFPAIIIAIALVALSAHAAEVMPPKPAGYFNDYANVVSSSAAQRFNEQLAQFERETSNQVVVAILPRMQSDSDAADYGQRIAQAWEVGSKSKRNGVLLLVFVADRKISIQVGYGLEGALPDATAYDIRAFQITPHFRSGDYEGGIAAGINSIIQAIRGEYKGTGKTVREGPNNKSSPIPFIIFFVIFAIVLYRTSKANRAGRRGGYRYSGFGGPYTGGWSGGSGGGWSSGGSSGGGGGFSGFSGGGGSFGGGGSSGGW